MPSAPARPFPWLRLAVSPALVLALAGGCGPRDEPSPTPAPSEGAPAAAHTPAFEDVTERVGLDFRHENGMSGDLYYVEVIGPGGAFFDADRDGDLDLYLVQGGPLEPGMARDPDVKDRLLLNRLAETGELGFVDVTEGSGLEATGYGMGVATGDVNNDGWTDLYVTNFGPNQLWLNQGVGPDGRITFRDVTAETGVDDPRWSLSASFVDVDADGWLDLYVVNYVDFRFANHKPCASPSGLPEYCGPKSYEPETDRLFRNLGAAAEPGGSSVPRFDDVTGAAGILAESGAGMGTVTADFDGDGDQDVYAANDQYRNQLWINDGSGRFTDRGLIAGAATNLEGMAESSMGVDAADFDNDGDHDLFMTHIDSETNTLFLNDGQGNFRDGTFETRIGPASVGRTGFGAVWFDAENDGWLDLAVVNGAVKRLEDQIALGKDLPLEQPNQFFANRSAPGRDRRHYEAVGEEEAPCSVSEVSRGLAVGDVDDDGDADLLLTNNHGPARLLLNRHDGSDDWLGLRVLDSDGRREALGAVATLRRAEGPDLVRRVRTDGSFLSAHDPRVLFGLGDGGEPLALHVRWPDGSEEEWDAPPRGQYTTVVRGTGRPPRP